MQSIVARWILERVLRYYVVIWLPAMFSMKTTHQTRMLTILLRAMALISSTSDLSFSSPGSHISRALEGQHHYNVRIRSGTRRQEHVACFGVLVDGKASAHGTNRNGKVSRV